MRVQGPCLWSLSLFVTVSAVLTNHTIDDQALGVTYASGPGEWETSLSVNVEGIVAATFDPKQLFNQTVSYILGSEAPVEVSFTGNAIYVFGAMAGNLSFGLDCLFLLDRILVGSFRDASLENTYNTLEYSNRSIPDGIHTLTIHAIAGAACFLDYVVYTSNESDPISSAGDSTSSPGNPTSISDSSRTSSTATSPIMLRKKPPVAIIAGSVIGAIAVLAAIGAGLWLCERAHRRRLDKGFPDPGKSTRTSSNAALIPAETCRGESAQDHPDASTPVLSEPAALTEQVRTLQEQVQQLQQHAGGSSSAGWGPTSLARSLSMMKRDQMRAVQDHQDGYGVTDAFVHTNSGLRLTVGRREIEELPPTYAED